MKRPFFRFHAIVAVLFIQCVAIGSFGQSAVRQRIQGAIDDSRLITLHGNTPPLARPEFDEGAAPDDLPAGRMVLLLWRAPEQQAALDSFLAAQQDPASPNYLHWLTPAEFGKRFGPSDADVAAVTNWLGTQGFVVNRISDGKTAIEFSGTAATVTRAFHTALHRYAVNGGDYWANAQDPQIPAALTPVVRGIISLNNFPRKRLSHRTGLFARQQDGSIVPQYTGSDSAGSYYALAPADFASIYNTTPLLQAGNNGAGQTIAVIGLSNVHLSDIASFRTLFGLGTGNVSVEFDGPDPGVVSGPEDESVLDLEWTSAVAPGASVVLVAAQDTETTSGLDLAALHVIDENVAGVMNISYGLCEAALGTTENQYLQSLYQQAAAQGITVVVSSGDSGSAGCDYQGAGKIAQHGLGVNGMASTAYNVAVGGTDFNDVGTQSTYWNATNDPTTHASAKGYIPEVTWNSTCASTSSAANLTTCPAMPASGTPSSSSGLEILAGAGGPSTCAVATSSGGTNQCQSGRPKPSWQTGSGVPSDGVRDLPDLSLFGAVNSKSESFYIVCQSDVPGVGSTCYPGSSFSFLGVGGTSAGAASFSGIVALAEQKAGTRLGNLNYLLYSLAAQQGASCTSASTSPSACIFNDVTGGNISVPCKAGTPNCSVASGTATGVIVDSSQSPAYAARAGYDFATGLGSVNVNNLVNGIAAAVKNAAPTSLSLTLNGSTGALTAQHGDSISIGVSVTPAASAGTVSVGGKSGDMTSATLSGGSATWNSKLFVGGQYAVTAHYPGDATHAASDSNPIDVTITPEPSQALLSLVTFDAKGGLQSYTSNSVVYGSPYILRMDVGDAAATMESTNGVSSTCSNGAATCATGSVTLTANGSPLDGGTFALNSKGYSEDWLVQLAAGSVQLGVSYAGDASYKASTGTLNLTVAKAPTTLTAATPITGALQYGSASQVNASVSTTSSGLAPGGTYSFFEDGAATTHVLSGYTSPQSGSGSTFAGATYSASYIPYSLGSHTLYAAYSGDTNYQGSDSSAAPFTVNVVQAKTFASSYGASLNGVLATVPITLNIYVQSTSVLEQPSGTVTFYDNGNPISGTVSYSGHAGTGSYYDAALQAQLQTTFPAGAHTITATYSGDSHYTSLTQSLATINTYDHVPTTPSFTTDLNPTLVNYATKLTAVFSANYWPGAPAMTGTVTFSDNGQPISGSVTYVASAGQYTATLPDTFTASGTHNITASYSGDSNYAGSTSTALSLSVVDKLPTAVNFYAGGSAVVNRPVNLPALITAKQIYVGPVMGGTVTFSDGGTPLTGTAQLSAYAGGLNANLTVAFTTPGIHSLTANYSGDSNYAASQSQAVNFDVFGLLAIRLMSPTQAISSSGGSSSGSMWVYNNSSTALPVTFTCTADSTNANCSVNPSSLTVSVNNTNIVAVTFNVPRLGAAVHQRWPFSAPFVLAGVLAGLPLLTRKKRALLLTAIALALVLTLVSCGGGGGATSAGNTGTSTSGSTVTSKTYKFTVTATSGSYTDTQVLTVTQQ